MEQIMVGLCSSYCDSNFWLLTPRFSFSGHHDTEEDGNTDTEDGNTDGLTWQIDPHRSGGYSAAAADEAHCQPTELRTSRSPDVCQWQLALQMLSISCR